MKSDSKISDSSVATLEKKERSSVVIKDKKKDKKQKVDLLDDLAGAISKLYSDDRRK